MEKGKLVKLGNGKIPGNNSVIKKSDHENYTINKFEKDTVEFYFNCSQNFLDEMYIMMKEILINKKKITKNFIESDEIKQVEIKNEKYILAKEIIEVTIEKMYIIIKKHSIECLGKQCRIKKELIYEGLIQLIPEKMSELVEDTIKEFENHDKKNSSKKTTIPELIAL